MSDDLISRSAVIEEFYKRIGGDLTFEDVQYIEKVIESIPTAYDVGKVVEQLEKIKEGEHEAYMDASYSEDDHIHRYAHRIVIRIMEIVKAGGVNE